MLDVFSIGTCRSTKNKISIVYFLYIYSILSDHKCWSTKKRCRSSPSYKFCRFCLITRWSIKNTITIVSFLNIKWLEFVWSHCQSSKHTMSIICGLEIYSIYIRSLVSIVKKSSSSAGVFTGYICSVITRWYQG